MKGAAQSPLKEEAPMPALEDAALRQLFLDARTHMAWQDRPVSDELLHQVYDLARMGPTGGNSSPFRVVFVKSAAGKEKLKPTLNPGNVDKTMNAPATAIVAWDSAFYEQMPKLFPGRDMKTMLTGLPAEVRDRMGLQGGTLQGAYLILAARALGLDCGPMAGFDNAKVDQAFFVGSTWKSNFLVNLGYGEPTKLFPRLPRLDFAEAARIE
jgi:3-hydroxypropanoate dehydrogenase